MLQGGEGCQEFARVVGDLPVQTLDLTANTSGECNVTAVIISYQSAAKTHHGPHCKCSFHPLRSENQPQPHQARPTLKRVI